MRDERVQGHSGVLPRFIAIALVTTASVVGPFTPRAAGAEQAYEPPSSTGSHQDWGMTPGGTLRDQPATDAGLRDATSHAPPASGRWRAIITPPGRAGLSAVYDPIRRRMTIFGGYNHYQEFMSDVWSISLTASSEWGPVFPAGTPPPGRYFHAAVYDPIRDRMIVIGGYNGGNLNDVWALSLGDTAAWTRLFPAGTPPAGRWGHAMVYDPSGDRILLVGGDAGGYRNDVWELRLAGTPAWSQLTPVGAPPSPRRQHSAIYDGASHRVIVFGGFDGSLRNDVWQLALTNPPAWSPLAAVGGPPPARRGHVAVHDPIRAKMVVFGGIDGGYRNDLWLLSLDASPQWSAPLVANPPAVRYTPGAVYDAANDDMVVFGGDDGPTRRNDTWGLDLGSITWVPVGSAIQPPGRWGQTMIYDSPRGRAVMFGGALDGLFGTNETWTLALESLSSWVLLQPSGTPPSARRQHAAVYDPVRDRMIVVGGNDGSLRSDVWALTLQGSGSWSQIIPTGSPPTGRRGHTAIYDPNGDRILVFGGIASSYLNDTWSLSLGPQPAWTQLSPAGPLPAPRYTASATYDRARNRMIVFGGDGGPSRLNDTWALSLGAVPTWQQLSTAGGTPRVRAGHSAVYDSHRSRIVIFGGYDAYTDYLSDVWALSTQGTPTWTMLSPAGYAPVGRYFHGAVCDPVMDRMLMYGGWDGVHRGDSWLLDWATTGPQPEVAPAKRSEAVSMGTPALGLGRPDPFVSSVTVSLRLTSGGSGRLGVYDASGRRVRTLASGFFPEGDQEIVWDGEDDDSRPVPPGVYFMRLELPEGTISRKLHRSQ